MAGGLFQTGLVEHVGERQPNPTRELAITKVTEGIPLTDAEENALLWEGLEEI
jgi:hypothetical protein